MFTIKDFQGVNSGYLLELYERYESDPRSVDAETREFFTHWKPPPNGAATHAAAPASAAMPMRKIVGAVNLAESIRKFGHLAAQIDPLGEPREGDPSLLPETHGISEDDLRQLPASVIVGEIAEGKANAFEVIQELRRVYMSGTGYDYAHLRDVKAREWLRNAAESGFFRPPSQPIDEVQLLERLTQEGVFELFLDRTFPGKTRFSIQGLGTLIPMLDAIIEAAAEAEVRQVLIGMAHRARLNVLAHVLNKPYKQILAEFKDPAKASQFRGDVGWTGDVKYHSGAHHAVRNGKTVSLMVAMAPNPSHLEAVNPVVEGMARAAGTRAGHRGEPMFVATLTLPILIHGDAAFPAQGIVTESLNLFRLPGYQTGGTLHLIANNQIGFTTDAAEGRSMIYASDAARGFRIPIVHVNADDPEACIEAARLAFAYRALFHKDFLIDLIGYRRHGHNEGDEPGFTQPLMYQKIASHPTVRQIWAGKLEERGLIKPGLAEELVHKHMEHLHQVLASLNAERELVEPRPAEPVPGAARRAQTAVEPQRLRELNRELLQLPAGFNLHRKIQRVREKRLTALDTMDERTVDWAAAEELALASILQDGIPIRMTGQDVERGTFSHRHAVFHDVKTGERYIPLQALPQAKAGFEIHNSPLSENAALGFEYGYNVQEPGRLVIWEAQYGDFINGAQTIIDEFVVSARAKWGLSPSLVMLLPHGMEGQGPDHSSARPERFLQLAAADNLRVANCTTAAQFFHLLRLQTALLYTDPLPLIVLTPKSLLRHPMVTSSLRDLAEGGFQRVIDDARARQSPASVSRLILCSGKVYVDLMSSSWRAEAQNVAICRLEMIYPFPEDDVRALLAQYPKLREVVWLQEEPRNMGAWEFLRLQLARLIDGQCPLLYIGRPRGSSPAEGSSAWHALNQAALIQQAFDLKEVHVEESVLLRKTN